MSSESLPPDLAQFVANQLALGKYGSASDVVCDAVRLMREREERLEALRTEVDRGIAQLESGDFVELDGEEDIDAFFNDVLARADQRNASSRGGN
jgi:antitoxin ParD1/3/4